MKTIHLIFSIFVSFLFAHNAAAQEVRPLENELTDSPFLKNVYYKDTNNYLQDLVGSWVYEDATDYFKITFYMVRKKPESYDNTNMIFNDRLYANYILKKHGITIYDNTNTVSYSSSDTVNRERSVLRSAYLQNGELSILYDEPSFTGCYRTKRAFLDIKKLSPSSIIWTRLANPYAECREPCENGLKPDDSDFLIPAEMVLERVKE